MAKILFDIVGAPAATGYLPTRLLLEISGHIFSYAVLNQEKELLRLRFYEMDARNGQALVEELDGILGKDEHLQEGNNACTLVYNFAESQLVPEAFFTPSAGNDYIHLIHGDVNHGTVLNERVTGHEQYNVFRVPADLHNLLQRRFPGSHFAHYYSLWMQYAGTCFPGQTDFMAVVFYPNRILAAVVKNNQVQLLQSFDYQAAEDVGYYLLNICGQLDLSPSQTNVILSGMIDVSSALYTEIIKYFGQVSLDTVDNTSASEQLQDYPPHFFSPILKLAACVS